MNLIIKQKSPNCLKILNEDDKNTYKNLKGNCRKEVLESLKSEQNNICAYCDRKMKTVQIEHYIPQTKNPELQLDYNNFLGVCFGMFFFDRKNNVGVKYCESHRGNQDLKFDPKEKTHIDSIYFDSEGFVKSTDSTIQKNFDTILNLNFEELREERISNFVKESDNLAAFCSEFNIDKKNGILRMLKLFEDRSHKRFLTEKFKNL